jgi:hypothetical protein
MQSLILVRRFEIIFQTGLVLILPDVVAAQRVAKWCRPNVRKVINDGLTSKAIDCWL